MNTYQILNMTTFKLSEEQAAEGWTSEIAAHEYLNIRVARPFGKRTATGTIVAVLPLTVEGSDGNL